MHIGDWLASLQPVEEASARRVADSGFFRGLKAVDIVDLAEQTIASGELQLRKGWLDLFELFLPSSNPPAGSELSILSVNWSEAWIRWCLISAAGNASYGRRQELVDFIHLMRICANGLDGLHAQQGSTGGLIGGVNGPIRTSADKLRYLTSSRSKGNGKLVDGDSSRGSPVVVYVGDSSTDFDCLRCADVGTWLADVPMSQYKTKFAEVFRPLIYEPPLLKNFHRGQLCAWTPSLEDVAQHVASLTQKVYV